MTLLEKLIEKKNYLNATGLVKVCAGILMSATILTGCANAGEIKGNETSTTKEGTSITEQAKSETELNYERLMEACKKTDALGPIVFESNIKMFDEYRSSLYFFNNRKAAHSSINGEFAINNTYVVCKDGIQTLAIEVKYPTLPEVEPSLKYEEGEFGAASLYRTIDIAIRDCEELGVKYDISYDVATRKIKIASHPNEYNYLLRYDLTLDEDGRVETFDTYMDETTKDAHYTLRTVTEAEFNEKFEEYSKIINEYKVRYEEKQNESSID